jgi:hypothetical protein
VIQLTAFVLVPGRFELWMNGSKNIFGIEQDSTTGLPLLAPSHLFFEKFENNLFAK